MLTPEEIDAALATCDYDASVVRVFDAYAALLEAQPAIERAAVERFVDQLEGREDELQTIIETCVLTGDQGNAFAASERLREVEAMLAALKASEGGK